jgi:hypothetical protein
MPPSLRLIAVLLLAFTLGGCSLLRLGEDASAGETRDFMTRQELSEGYSLLYSSAGSLRHADKGLYLKVESDALDRVVTDIAAYGAELRGEMERIERDYPAVEIDLEPLPEMEERRRTSARNERLKQFAPLVGLSGPVFERELLLTLSGVLNQTRYLTRALAEGEPEASLSEAMVIQERHIERLYERVVTLLETQHFR